MGKELGYMVIAMRREKPADMTELRFMSEQCQDKRTRRPYMQLRLADRIPTKFDWQISGRK